jgi:hypothetical protein
MARRRQQPQASIHPLPVPPRRIPTAELEAAVAHMLTTGARSGQLRSGDTVTPIVDLLAPPRDQDTLRGGARAAAAQKIIEEAIASIGGDYARVLEILLQLVPEAVGKSMTRRREMCAALLEVSVTTFRTKDAYEAVILRIFTDEVHRILRERGLAA